MRRSEAAVVDAAATLAAVAGASPPDPGKVAEFGGRMSRYLRRRRSRRFALNAFCPTGPGGGVDPTCGKGDRGKGKKIALGPAVKQITGRLKDPRVKKQVEDTLDELRSRYPAMAALKPITTVDLRKGEAGGGEYYGDGGVGAPTVMIIYAEGLPLTSPKLEFGGDVLIGSVREAVAHEYGHHLWDGTKPAKRKEWQKLYGEVGADGWKKVSEYAASHPEEGFSESLAAFTHPSYSGGLPAAAEGYFRKLLGGVGRGKENASVLQEYSPLPELLAEYERLRENAFCPTGKGGGRDPTCSPGGKPGPKTKIRTQHRMRQAAAGKTGEGKGKKPPAPATPKPPEPKPSITIDYDQADPHHPEARKIWDDHGGRRRLESFLAKTAGMEAEGFKLQELRDKAFKLGSDHHTATQEWLKLAKSKSKAKDHPKKLKAAKANMDRLRAEHDEAISARNEAIKQADTLPERGRAALLEVMGVSSPSVVAYSSKGKKTYDWESEGLEPTGDTKVAIDDGLGFASRLTGGGHKSDVKMSLSTDGRAHYVPGGPTSGAIAMGRTTGDLADLDSGKKKEGYPGQRKRLMEDTAYTAAHEVGHHYENTIPGLRDRARAFLDYRLQGETVIQMNRKPGMSSLRDDEYGAKDRFDKAFGTSDAYYVGKQYHRDTEVVSMGLQKLYQDPVGFARRDPEYFQWLTTALRGGEGNQAENVFCPTGEGGGIDPTCSPGGKGGGVAGGEVGGRVGWAKQLADSDPEAARAIRYYTGVGFAAVNFHLRNKTTRRRDDGDGSDEEYDDLVKSIDRALEVGPKHEGKVYRGLSFDSDRELDAFVARARETGVVTDPAYASSSTSEGRAAKHAHSDGVMMRIQSKTGVDVKDASREGYEDEVLFPRDTKFKVLSITMDGERTVMDLEEE